MRGNGRVARPPPPRRHQIAGIAGGPELLERQGTAEASGFRPREFGPQDAPTFGGGTSPVKIGHPIHRDDIGKLAVWEGDGYLAISRVNYLHDAPADGLVYARNGLENSWVPVASGAGIPEAPTDGRTYTRTGLPEGWAPLPYIIPEAPADGQGYVRIGVNGVWSPAFTQAQGDARYASIATTSFPESPTDGRAYARRGWDQAWIPVATDQGVEEAPVDGYLYVRRGSDETWQLAFTKAQADSLYAVITAISATAPTGAQSGDFWFDGTQLYVWYDDGTAPQWVVASDSGGGATVTLPLAIADGGTGATTGAQARINLGITAANLGITSFPEAPLIGGPYGRQSGGWVTIDVSGGALVEAPTDGYLYVRRGSDASWQLAFTKAQADSLYAPVMAMSMTPPSVPQPGDLWFDPVGTQLYVYYDDGTSAQWVGV